MEYIGLHDDIMNMKPVGSGVYPWEQWMVDLPDGRSGKWTISHYNAEGIERLRCARDYRGMPPGRYTRLWGPNGIMMTDTPAEMADHRELLQTAGRLGGRVLLHGLGLGMALKMVLAINRVTSVDVVELSSDVISLVGPHYKDDRVTIHHDDALTRKWPRGVRWNVVWHDIWQDISVDNEPQMKLLTRSFARRCNWQGCWSREWAKRTC